MPDLSDAVETLLNTRNFCGSETEALKEWEQENGKLSPEQRAEVRETARVKWAAWGKLPPAGA